MQKPNEHGCYQAEATIELARRGWSSVQAHLARCDDGLFRFSLSFQYSQGGGGGPITRRTEGYISAELAEAAAFAGALGYFCHDSVGHPDSVRKELAQLREQLLAKYQQPRLL